MSAQLYNRFLNFNVHNLNYFSSHCAISFPLITNIFSIESNVNDCSLSPFPDTFKWSAEDDLLFQTLVSSYFVNSNTTAKIDGILETATQDSIDLATEPLTNKIKISATKCFKLKKIKKKRKKVKTNKKWFDRSCIESKRLFTEAAKSLTIYPKDTIIRGRYHTLKKEHKQLIKKEESQLKRCLLDNINNLQTNNSKEYWSMVNRLKEAKQDNTIDNIDPSEWHQWFKALNTKENQVKKQRIWRKNTVNSRKEALFCRAFCENTRFTCKAAEITKACCELKNNKACGVDSISNEILKSIIYTKFNTLLVKLFNKILENSKFPCLWKRGYITPIYKADDSFDPSNYRGITVTSDVGKLFTLVINERLVQFLDENKVIVLNQIGFRRGYRTADHLFILNTIINSYFKKGEMVYVCFVDFSKTYDTVWRVGLFYKLIKYGLSLKFIKLIENMYSNIQYAVKLSDGITPFFISTVGVRQGCNLSPMLFNLIINDINKIF